MSYEIEARIENDCPCLRILDADSHALRLVWHYPRPEDPPSVGAPEPRAEQRAIHDLFRELFLLSLVRHEEGEVWLKLAAASENRPADRYNR